MDFIFDPSLVLYLPLYQLDGSSFMSQDACGHLCTVTGAAWRPYSRYFDGSDDKIALPTSLSLANVNAYTVEVWARTSDISHDGLVWGEGNTTTSMPMICAPIIEGSLLKYYHRDDANNLAQCVADASDIANDTSFHLACVRKASNSFELYLNGVRKATSSVSVGATTVNTLWIGVKQTTSYGGYWLGDIGELRVYKERALTPPEVQHNYLATKWRYR